MNAVIVRIDEPMLQASSKSMLRYPEIEGLMREPLLRMYGLPDAVGPIVELNVLRIFDSIHPPVFTGIQWFIELLLLRLCV